MKIKKIYNCTFMGDITHILNVICCILQRLQNYSKVVSEDTLFDVKVILNELLFNAIKHGNKNDMNKKLKIIATILNEKYLLIIIEDEGLGYCYDNICLKDKNCDIQELSENGRGLYIVKTLSYKIKFNESGNKIYVLKKLY